MAADLDEFRRAAEKRLKEYEDRKQGKRVKKPLPAVSHLIGHEIRLAVREKKISQDYEYVYISNKASVLEAKIEAEKSAHNDGWPIVSYIIDITPMYHE